MLLQFLSLVKKFYSDAKIALTLDAPTSTLNNFKVYSGYKQNRNKEEKKEVYSYLNKILRQLVSSLDPKSFAFIKAKGFESDQILGYIVKKYYKKHEIIVFSGDKDLLQLSSYPNVFISEKFEKGNFILKTDTEIFQKFKNSKGEDFTRISKNKKDILKYRVLKGDSSDNLSPVFPRIKDKEIVDILKNYWIEDTQLSDELIDTIVKKVREQNVALAEKLSYNKNTWLRNYKIMDLFHVEGIKVKRLL